MMKQPKSDSLAAGFTELLRRLACAEIRTRNPASYTLGAGIYGQSGTVEAERHQRELALDRIHSALEGTPRPKEPVILTLCTRDRRRIEFRFDSLKTRNTPSARKRQRRARYSILNPSTSSRRWTPHHGWQRHQADPDPVPIVHER